MLGVLRDNLTRRGGLLPLSRGAAGGWADGLGIPRGGRTVLFTGLMYQLMPALVALERLMARFEDSAVNRLTGLARAVNRGCNASRLVSLLVDRKDRQLFDGILRDIAITLRAAGEDFGYLYEEEMYAGALAHDQGLCSTFEQQVLRVHALLRRHGVQRVITVDPHTTNVLRTVLPRLVSDGVPEVRSYLEVLAERRLKSARPLEGRVVIHDSCVYARHERLVDEPRELLRALGVEAAEPEYSGRLTFCCGGPIETLFPGRARSIAERRIEQLSAIGSQIVTMCPVCLVNLRAAAAGKPLAVGDISSWLARGVATQRPVGEETWTS